MQARRTGGTEDTGEKVARHRTGGPGKRALLWLAVGMFLLSCRPAFAADTLEQFDPGFSDFELYFNYSGAGRAEPDRGVGGETLVGIGITDWLSGQIVLSGEANEELSEGTGAFSFGAFATPIDTDHFDVDLGINVTVGGIGPGKANPAEHNQADVIFTPFAEINIDTDPEMNGFGAWVWVEHAFGGRDDSRFDNAGNEIRDFTLTSGTALLVGAYYRFLEVHELVLAYDLEFKHDPSEGERTFNNGGPSLGYNVMVVPDRLELISEVRFDVPQDGEHFGTDFLLGFIATFPPND